MIINSASIDERNFKSRWIIACLIGYALGGAVSVVAGDTLGYFLGDKLGIALTLSSSNKEFLSDLVASLLVGTVAGGIENISQSFILQKYLLHAKWWITAGVASGFLNLGLKSITVHVVTANTTNDLLFILLVLLATALLSPFNGLLSGFLELQVLKKDLPDPRRWMRVRCIMYVVTFIIFLVFDIVNIALHLSLGQEFIANLLEGIIPGIFFGVVSGRYLYSLFIEKTGAHTEIIAA